MTEDEVNSKKDSRKFFVFTIWLVIAIVTFIGFFTYLIITKSAPKELVDFAILIAKYFFAISLTYLGVNVAQKGIYAAKDVLSKDKSE